MFDHINNGYTIISNTNPAYRRPPNLSKFVDSSTNALWFLVLLLWQIFLELFQGLWKHSGESQGTQVEFLATYNNYALG